MVRNSGSVRTPNVDLLKIELDEAQQNNRLLQQQVDKLRLTLNNNIKTVNNYERVENFVE